MQFIPLSGAHLQREPTFLKDVNKASITLLINTNFTATLKLAHSDAIASCLATAVPTLRCII